MTSVFVGNVQKPEPETGEEQVNGISVLANVSKVAFIDQ